MSKPSSTELYGSVEITFVNQMVVYPSGNAVVTVALGGGGGGSKEKGVSVTDTNWSKCVL